MYAIVSIAGQQFKVAKDQQIFVHRLQGDEGASIEFDNVLLAENEGKFKLGTDLKSAKVSAKIVSHLKGDKVIIFKKKRRKGYKKKNGHRQYLTQIQISGITAAATKKAAPKKEAVAADAEVEAPKKKVAKAKKEDTQE